MGINNRSKDPSEQREVINYSGGLVAEAEVREFHVAPRPQLVEQIKIAALGITEAPELEFDINRFIVGTGNTVYTEFATLLLANVGTSGLQTLTYAASLLLEAGDVMRVTLTATGAQALELSVVTVVKNLQDIKTNFGVSY